MSICESCGADGATLFTFYPATLCPECVAIRVAERKAVETYREAAQKRKAAESAPDPRMMFSDPETSAPESVDPIEPKPGKKARRTERKQAARIALEAAKRNLGVQAALVRVQLNAGDENATLVISKALLVAFLQTAFASLTGCKVISHTTDQVVARLRVANLIDSAAMTAIVSAMAATESPTTAALYLRAIEVLAFGPESESDKARRSRRRRILREGERLACLLDISPVDETADRFTDMAPVSIDEGRHHGIHLVRVGGEPNGSRVGEVCDDSPQGLRKLSGILLAIQSRLQPGESLRINHFEPSTVGEGKISADEPADTNPLRLAGIIHEAEIMRVLGIDRETWGRDYRMHIPGLTTPKGRFYSRSVLQDFVAKHSTSPDEAIAAE